MQQNRRQRQLWLDAEAGARVSALLMVSVLFMVTIILITAITDPIVEGVKEGEMAPGFTSYAHDYGSGTTWREITLEEMTDSGWNETSQSDSKWLAIIFLSPDCGHCLNSGDEIEQMYWNHKDRADFYVISVDFANNDAFTSNRAEIIAFQEKLDNNGCNGGNFNCADRHGGPHPFPYIDDRTATIMMSWEVGGTPAYFLLKPNGIVAYNQQQHTHEEDMEWALEHHLY